MPPKTQRAKGKVRLSHGQAIKQSHNYHSAEASFSAEIVVPNSPKSIRRGYNQLVDIVEESLARKVDQQREFLHNLTGS